MKQRCLKNKYSLLFLYVRVILVYKKQTIVDLKIDCYNLFQSIMLIYKPVTLMLGVKIKFKLKITYIT